MNSLSLLSSQVEKVIGATPPPTPRTESFKGLQPQRRSSSLASSVDRSYLSRRDSDEAVFSENEDEEDDEDEGEDDDEDVEEEDDDEVAGQVAVRYRKRRLSLGERIYIALLSPWLGAFRWVLTTIAVSTNWFISCVRDEQGMFSPLMPVRRATALVLRPFGGAQNSASIYSASTRSQYWSTTSSTSPMWDEKRIPHPSNPVAVSTSPIHHFRSKSFSHDPSDLLMTEVAPQRSIRIRLYNEDPLARSKPSSVKSPTSPSSSLRLTKYPRNCGPPKPLLPSHPLPKTLILDLDETLIHSLAKGGRMTSGHMVEVKLEKQHAILYYVHKRPHCDDFLRKVSSATTSMTTLRSNDFPCFGRKGLQMV